MGPRNARSAGNTLHMTTARLMTLAFMLLTAACALGCSAPYARSERTVAPSQREFFDVPYAEDSPRQQADVYLPKEGEGPFPVIVYLHGGGYVDGDKTALVPGLVEVANARGYAVVSAGYRLLHDADFPAQVADVKAVIRWVRASHEEYAFDTDAIALWGVSAGGHLAALAGTSAGVPELTDVALGNASESEAVDAVVDWFGPADFIALRDYLEHERQQSGGRVTFALDYITQHIDSSPELVQAANPSWHADPDDPPILIHHGDSDAVVPLQQSLILANELSAFMGEEKVTLWVESGEGHGTGVFLTRENLERTLDWIESARSGATRPGTDEGLMNVRFSR